MKKLKRKFAISILAMIFAVVALGSTTFAWFAMTGKAEVSSIEASVIGGDGLEIRLKDDEAHTQWTAGYLDLALSDYFKNTLMKGVNLAPVHYSSISGTTPNFKKVEQTASSVKYVDAAYTDEADEVKDYVKFTLQFRSVKAGVINLVDESTMVGMFGNEEGSFNWTPDVPYKKTNDSEEPDLYPITTSAANAARILTVQNNVVTNLSSTTVNVFENKEDLDVGNTEGLNTAAEDFGAVGYFKKKTGINDLKAIEEFTSVPTKILGVTASIATLANPNEGAGTNFFDNKDYYYAEVDVYIYMEGWDKECLNALFNSGLKIDLAFEQANL